MDLSQYSSGRNALLTPIVTKFGRDVSLSMCAAFSAENAREARFPQWPGFFLQGTKSTWFSPRRRVPARPLLISARQDGSMDVQGIITHYAAILAQSDEMRIVRDVRRLPHRKSQIKEALKVALAVTTDEASLEQFRVAYVCLADFQPLTKREALALWRWNLAVATSDTVIELIECVRAEAEGLREELIAGGLW